MTSERENLKSALEQYALDTCNDIETVQLFIQSSDQWIRDRQAEAQALDGDSGEELGTTLEKILSGLNDLQLFLEAVERLAVTSVHVFHKELFTGADLEALCLLLHTARVLSPLLLLFKLDNKSFFRPEVLNKEVYQSRLQHYINAVQTMCDGWKRSSLDSFSSNHPTVQLNDLSDYNIKEMLLQIVKLDTLRKDQSFWMVDLLGDRSQIFRETFSVVRPQMLHLMGELEGCAQQLDSMNLGARVSGTVSSSLGIVGGVMSIAGLICAPFTAGASLVLTAAGAGLGVVSGVEGIVTTATELGVNNTQTKKAEDGFNKCVQLMKELQEFLKDVIQQRFKHIHENVLIDVIEATYSGAMFADSLAGLGSVVYEWLIKRLDRVWGLAADAHYDVIKDVVAVGRMRKVPVCVAEGTVAVARTGTQAARLAKCIKVGSGLLNGAFAVVDGYFLYRDIKSLADGTETEHSKWIRARVSLWSSEIDSWQKVQDSVIEGEKVYEEYTALLKTPFLPFTSETKN